MTWYHTWSLYLSITTLWLIERHPKSSSLSCPALEIVSLAVTGSLDQLVFQLSCAKSHVKWVASQARQTAAYFRWLTKICRWIAETNTGTNDNSVELFVMGMIISRNQEPILRTHWHSDSSFCNFSKKRYYIHLFSAHPWEVDKAGSLLAYKWQTWSLVR